MATKTTRLRKDQGALTTGGCSACGQTAYHGLWRIGNGKHDWVCKPCRALHPEVEAKVLAFAAEVGIDVRPL